MTDVTKFFCFGSFGPFFSLFRAITGEKIFFLKKKHSKEKKMNSHLFTKIYAHWMICCLVIGGGRSTDRSKSKKVGVPSRDQNIHCSTGSRLLRL